MRSLRAIGNVPQRNTPRCSRATSAGVGSNVPTGELYAWDPDSTYVKNPPYFDGMPRVPAPVTDISGARVLAMLGDSVTTDHISPAGNISDERTGREVPLDMESHGRTSTRTARGAATTKS